MNMLICRLIMLVCMLCIAAEVPSLPGASTDAISLVCKELLSVHSMYEYVCIYVCERSSRCDSSPARAARRWRCRPTSTPSLTSSGPMHCLTTNSEGQVDTGLLFFLMGCLFILLAVWVYIHSLSMIISITYCLIRWLLLCYVYMCCVVFHLSFCRKHVFGMSSTLYSGSAISILPFNPTDRNLSSRQGQGRKTPTAWGENQDSTAGIT